MIEKTSQETKQAILRKTPWAHSTRPGDDGMPAAQVKKMFYTAIADDSNSVLAEMERMRQEANTDIATKVDKAVLTDDVEAHCDSHHIPSTLAIQRQMDRDTNVYRLYYTYLTVMPTAWREMEVAIGHYTYYADIELPNVTDTMVPDLTFSPLDAVRPELATFCTTYTGRVRIYSTAAMYQPVYIENLVCYIPTHYTVLTYAPHTVVHIVDEQGKIYANGDVVAAHALLTITVEPEEGYALDEYRVSGARYLEGQTAEYWVTGTVLIEATPTEVTA